MLSDVLTRLRSLATSIGLSVIIDPKEYEIKSPCAIDVEHDEQGNMVCVGVYDGRIGVCFTQINKRLSAELSSLEIIAHNGVGDIECLRSWGVVLKDEQLYWDTMLIGHLINPTLKTYGLKDIVKRELDIEYPSYDEIVGKHKGKTTKHPACNKQQSNCCGRITLDKQPIEIVSLYNVAGDCVSTYNIYLKQKGLIENGNL